MKKIFYLLLLLGVFMHHNVHAQDVEKTVKEIRQE
jgi:hypothetical protein